MEKAKAPPGVQQHILRQASKQLEDHESSPRVRKTSVIAELPKLDRFPAAKISKLRLPNGRSVSEPASRAASPGTMARPPKGRDPRVTPPKESTQLGASPLLKRTHRAASQEKGGSPPKGSSTASPRRAAEAILDEHHAVMTRLGQVARQVLPKDSSPRVRLARHSSKSLHVSPRATARSVNTSRSHSPFGDSKRMLGTPERVLLTAGERVGAPMEMKRLRDEVIDRLRDEVDKVMSDEQWRGRPATPPPLPKAPAHLLRRVRGNHNYRTFLGPDPLKRATDFEQARSNASLHIDAHSLTQCIHTAPVRCTFARYRMWHWLEIISLHRRI